MTPPLAPRDPSNEALHAPPDTAGVSGPIAEVVVDPLDQGSIAESPARALGATAVLPCEIWSTDFRERLDEDNPLRQGFQSAPQDGTAESVERLTKLHNAVLVVTTIDR